MIYKIYTDGLPDNKVIAHAFINIKNKSWSIAQLCNTKLDADKYLENEVAKWARKELLSFANQREQALLHLCLLDAYASLKIGKIRDCAKYRSAANTWEYIYNIYDDIIDLLPPAKSIQSGWFFIVAEIFQYAKSNIQHLRTA